jgi:hypothetical protein
MNKTQTVEGFFYQDRDTLTRKTAKKVLDLVISRFGGFRSVIDIGCGVGTWLSVAREMGASIIKGVEGPWINEVDAMVINNSLIEIVDLESEWEVDGNFDLGICLEVVEHVSTISGEKLIQKLSTICSIIVFSAAIPGQGGNGHVNEQWPTYWQERFFQNGMEAIDCIRPFIWNEQDIPLWYRQNIVIFVKKEIAQDYYKNLYKYQEMRTVPLLGIRICDPYLQNVNQPIKERFHIVFFQKIKKIIKKLYSKMVNQTKNSNIN